MALQLDDIVRVTASTAPAGVRGREFGRVLLLTTDPVLDATGPGKAKVFGSFPEVAEVFHDSSDSYKAAQTYFSQSPYPRPLTVARWVHQSLPWTLVGDSAPDTLTNLQALTTATLTLEGQTTAQFTLATASSLAGVAAAVQDALRAISGFEEVTVTYISSSNASSRRYSISAPFEITSALGGTAAEALGLNAGRIAEGQIKQSIGDAMDGIIACDDGWYFVAIDNSIVDSNELLELAEWVSANGRMLAADSKNAGVLRANENGSIAARLSAQESDRAFIVWSATDDYKALSLAARFSTVNFDGANTLITGKFKSLPGTVADTLDSASKRELDRKRINHYSPFGGDSILAEGWTLKPGGWIDVRLWLDWIVNRIQVDVYNLLRRHPTRVPQTRQGLASVKSAIENVCEIGRRNGGVASGTVSEALANDIRLAIGDVDFDGMLTRGYLVSVDSFESQSQQKRDDRLSPPFRVWLKGSGAIHFADIALSFEN